MRILGIDSSTTATGYAVIEDNKIIKSGVIKPQKKLDTIQRIIYIDNEIQKIYKKYKPNFIVIEEMVAFRNANAMRVLIGLIYHLVIEFTRKEALVVLARPSQVRKNKIKAKHRDEIKKQSIDYVNKKYKIKVLDDNESDAILLAEYGFSLDVEE